jgi:hypothetical protein
MSTRSGKSPRRKSRENFALLPAVRQSSAGAGAPADPVQPEGILGHTAPYVESEQRQAMIAEAAYYRAERRGFAAGHELEDWCAAESDIDHMLASGARLCDS